MKDIFNYIAEAVGESRTGETCEDSAIMLADILLQQKGARELTESCEMFAESLADNIEDSTSNSNKLIKILKELAKAINDVIEDRKSED